MLELAVSAAVMVSCLAGIVQFGYAFYLYNQLVTAVGNGGRYAALRTYRAATAQDVEKGSRAIRNMVAFGDAQPPPGAVPVVTKLAPEQVNVRWVTDATGAPTAVEVSIRAFTIDAIFRSFQFADRPSVEFPYVGRYAPGEREP